YTEGDLIAVMKHCGRGIEEEEWSEVLKQKEGLGTEATRAGIITVLKNRKYIAVEKNLVYGTPKGKLLISSLGESILASPLLTAKWEKRLSEIGQAKYAAKDFIELVRQLSEKIIADAKNVSTTWNFTEGEKKYVASVSKNATQNKVFSAAPLGTCIRCGGNVIDKGKIYGCENYRTNQCGFMLSKQMLGKAITPAQVKRLLKNESTQEIKGFERDGKVFDAKLKLEGEKLVFTK
ncbi:MAG: DNA topoisomerase, partial [Bacilli bacterium]